jgi:hypothetical protein
MADTTQESTQATRSAARRALASATDGDGSEDGEARIADQLVLSTAALTTEGIEVGRTLLGGAVQAVDTIVTSTLDTAESFLKSSPVEPMAAPTIDVARQVWSTSTTTLNEVLAQV